MASSRPLMLITGGSRGIGAATARLASQQGFDVCLAYAKDDAAAQAVAAQAQAHGAQALAVRADVAHEAEIVSLFEAVQARFGRLDALVNCAGITGTAGPVQAFEAADLDRLMRVNVIGTLLCSREAVKRMSRRQGGAGGAIVNVSSIASRNGPPMVSAYSASKGAIDAFTRGLAHEVADQGIRVNQVSPGVIDTDMQTPERLAAMVKVIPAGRVGQASEVAAAIVWLCGDAAAYVHATNVDVSGAR